jgi:hypothetical protein
MPTHPRRLALVAAALALAAPPPPAGAAVVDVPPVTVTSLTHQFTGSSARDVIFIPGAGYTSSGFTAAFGTGDVVRVRIQAPTGKKFQLRAPVRAPAALAPLAAAATGSFNVNVYWPCGGGDISHFNPTEVTFENFRGIPPALTYSLAAANEVIVETWFDYVTNGDFEFTAFRVDITVDQPLARVPRVFADVGSWASPSFGASSPTTSATFKALEIVDDFTVPAAPASWGRIKSLYR